MDIILLDAFHWTNLLQPQFYIENGGLWLLLFVVFAETGLFVGFFLPGDSLLFVAGIFAHKIEKVKELLVYDDLNLTEIAFKMHYSSVAHLSNQFKKVTGLSPSHFKRLKNKRRLTIQEL